MKKLIFIPYHDVNYFKNFQIMTREYALLKLMMDTEMFDLYAISKPRTILDKQKSRVDTGIFPQGSIENKIMEIIKTAHIIDLDYLFKWDIVTKKRGWWVKGYNDAFQKISDIVNSDTYIYSNNPFAYKLIQDCKKKGAKVIFDMMDNFAIHPSLSKLEKECAYEGYNQLIKISDFYCCNSVETQKFCKKNFSITPKLIKNGVFPVIYSNEKNKKREELKKIINNYEKTVGYIGKLGTRIDEKLVESLSRSLPSTVFTYIGPHLKGQKNKKLIDIFNNNNNIIEFGPISSYDIYSYLELFDILIIPHAVGKNENGGDPLKLYQYLNTGKKIITTRILGVEEFKEIVTVTNDYKRWINEIMKYDKNKVKQYDIPDSISWSYRAKSLIRYILDTSNKYER